MGFKSDGCFAEYVKLPDNLIHIIPSNIPLEDAALSEPLGVAVHSVINRCGIAKGDFVVVFGVGAIGLLCAQVARAEGASNVIVAGTEKDEGLRFGCAKELGLKTINVQQQDIYNVLMQRTHDNGADVVIEASGNAQAIHEAISIIRRTGRFVAAGITGQKELPLPWDELVSKAITLIFTYSSVKSDWDKGLALLADGMVNTHALITDLYQLSDWRRAFESLEQLTSIRPLLVVRDSAASH
jgi:L-iditol 2-dehydrogenase